MTDITFGNKPTSKTRKDAGWALWMNLPSRDDLAFAESGECNGTLPMRFLMVSDLLGNRSKPDLSPLVYDEWRLKSRRDHLLIARVSNGRQR